MSSLNSESDLTYRSSRGIVEVITRYARNESGVFRVVEQKDPVDQHMFHAKMLTQ